MESLQVASCLESLESTRAQARISTKYQTNNKDTFHFTSTNTSNDCKKQPFIIYLAHLVKFNRLHSLPTFPDDGRAAQLLQSRIRTAKPNLAKLLGNILAVWAFLSCYLFYSTVGQHSHHNPPNGNATAITRTCADRVGGNDTNSHQQS